MKIFADHFKSFILQPQLFSLFLVTLVIVILSFVVFFKSYKQKPDVAPKGIVFLAEQYVIGFDNFYGSVTEDKMNKPTPYIFTLLTFLFISNVFGVFGLEPPTSSYSVTLTIGLISWAGIYVMGLIYQKMHFFRRFINPTELVGQFSPLISISFRLFGNMIAGSTIVYLFYHFTGWCWSFVPVIGKFNILGAILAPPIHLFFDVFDALIQTIVFTMLTMIYWSTEIEDGLEWQAAKKLKKMKKSKIKNIQQKSQKVIELS